MSLLAVIVLLALVAAVLIGVGALFGVVYVAGHSGRRAQLRRAGHSHPA